MAVGIVDEGGDGFVQQAATADVQTGRGASLHRFRTLRGLKGSGNGDDDVVYATLADALAPDVRENARRDLGRTAIARRRTGIVAGSADLVLALVEQIDVAGKPVLGVGHQCAQVFGPLADELSSLMDGHHGRQQAADVCAGNGLLRQGHDLRFGR